MGFVGTLAQVKEIHSQFIHYKVESSLGGIYVTVVYGPNDIGETETLWRAIDTLADKIDELWMLARDFNNILSIELERIIHAEEIMAFQKCMDTNSLQEVRYIGNTYTWSNRTIYSKIDRVIANGKCFSAYTNIHYLVLPEGVSDHCPLVVKLKK
ncbi:LOW QUALITY PROTEIN: hypothetical protein Cgig2_010202 [Carnegiea gigantea]|uniref:Uncharacterized protein n=1 Tax=Carnegiea gigantea TaxID=171969 RepID=A0A9Q1GU38_9CARY|nr:LOW QUALITY PROTEIN: hypothetical protein Cgig2_010202 [Carnegiea gigantea]